MNPGDFTVSVEVWPRFDYEIWFGGDEYTTTSTSVCRAVFTYNCHAKGRREQFSRVYVMCQPCLSAYYNVWLICVDNMMELGYFVGDASEIDV